MPDAIEKLCKSTIQHGPENDRVYLMKLDRGDLPGILDELDRLVDENGYTKIFAKTPENCAGAFLERGYRTEAFVPGFFRGVEDAFFVSKFFSPERKRESAPGKLARVLAAAAKKRASALPGGPRSTEIEECALSDARHIVNLYGRVFETYPFPIDDPEYIAETMKSHVRYFCVRDAGRIVALSSCETDPEELNVEMTDFATARSFRGKGLGLKLLARMEKEMEKEGFVTAYSIARATSYGINITFKKAGYRHGGVLVNNTNICGRFESMNVWHKRLREESSPIRTAAPA